MRELPDATATPLGSNRDKIIFQAKCKYFGALANDTKWNELINYFRQKPGWRPSYRSKWINGHISEWDSEWHYHLPFPFVGVEWFDIGLHQHEFMGHLTPPRIIDHSAEIASKLSSIGFDYEVKGDVARIWGYFPKSYEDFPPQKLA
ncbi:hypothetical protein U737_05875 [Methylomonas sp. LW13]|uniref:DUF6678 family protein n=1 Tax=unclassified Methylomonas TaxID=2608980 RepID=UPI00051B2DFB|nr:DUF6678 family protein [Methylomonas sp. LW13]QBC26486.1 hypothetical protein U737_05875 [Methylomonas sp. LW13]